MRLSSLAGFLLFTVLAPIVSLPLASQRSVDEQAIRDLIQAHATAWNNRNAAAAAAVYAPDAVIHTTSGTVLQGRAAIENAHRQWLAEDTAGGGSLHSHPVASTHIQFVAPGVAVADVDGCFVSRVSNPESLTCAPLFIVVVKRAGHWVVVEQRALAHVHS